MDAIRTIGIQAHGKVYKKMKTSNLTDLNIHAPMISKQVRRYLYCNMYDPLSSSFMILATHSKRKPRAYQFQIRTRLQHLQQWKLFSGACKMGRLQFENFIKERLVERTEAINNIHIQRGDQKIFGQPKN